jgi:uncharacterized protein
LGRQEDFIVDLQTFFVENPGGALAFSGGTDSALLVWAAANYGADWSAYYVHSAFQPAFELEDAKKIAARCGLPLNILEADVLSCADVVKNPENRCYFCKKQIFGLILRQAAADGHSLIIDGTNASDDAGDRPGMKALRELQVRSPLRECGITKAQVRQMSRAAGLFTWSKPSYACLATRIPAGTPITAEALQAVERGENALFALGFSDFRIRLRGGAAVIQLPASQLADGFARREELLAQLSPIFPVVTLDLNPRS